VKKDNITEEQLLKALDDVRKGVNDRLPEFMAVSKFRIHPEEFAKTPKRSIKRFLYTKE
jgi:long-chain acyl-CoA synthetase